MKRNELKQLIKECYREVLSESLLIKESKDDNTTKYTVVQIGGSIGNKNIRKVSELKGMTIGNTKQLYDTYEEAEQKKLRLNKALSPGEKSYYGLKYVVAGVQNGKFTGKEK